jgi:hypothetical protein
VSSFAAARRPGSTRTRLRQRSAPVECALLLRRAPFPWRGIARSKGDQYDHDRARVPGQRASMPVLDRVGERAGKQGRFLRPRRDLGQRCRSGRFLDPRGVGNRRTSAPSGCNGLTVPDGPGDQPRQLGYTWSPERQVGCEFEIMPKRRRLLQAAGAGDRSG